MYLFVYVQYRDWHVGIVRATAQVNRHDDRNLHNRATNTSTKARSCRLKAFKHMPTALIRKHIQPMPAASWLRCAVRRRGTAGHHYYLHVISLKRAKTAHTDTTYTQTGTHGKCTQTRAFAPHTNEGRFLPYPSNFTYINLPPSPLQLPPCKF
jgi:hypothetical protein